MPREDWIQFLTRKLYYTALSTRLEARGETLRDRRGVGAANREIIAAVRRCRRKRRVRRVFRQTMARYLVPQLGDARLAKRDAAQPGHVAPVSVWKQR